MKKYFLFVLTFFSSLSFVSAQKKYMVKVTTLDDKVYRGLMFQIRDKDFLVLPNSAHWDFKVKENNIPRTKSFDYGIVKEIKIRRKGSVGKGILIGYVVGTALGIAIAKSNTSGYDPNDYLGISRGLKALATVMGFTGGGLLIGTIGGSTYPHQFEVKKDTFALHKLKVQLKKYEWYHAEKDTLINK